MATSLRHQPVKTVTCFFLAIFKNSVESLVFPAPASPEIKTVTPFPDKAASKHRFNSSSSFFLPTRIGSAKVPEGNF